jgi:hypothetical protein
MVCIDVTSGNPRMFNPIRSAIRLYRVRPRRKGPVVLPYLEACLGSQPMAQVKADKVQAIIGFGFISLAPQRLDIHGNADEAPPLYLSCIQSILCCNDLSLLTPQSLLQETD